MAVLSLPLSFTNSFWSQDYRRGLEVLFNKLEQGVAENDEVIAFIRARARLEGQIGGSLMNPVPTGPQDTGFGADDGASLLMAFRGLQAESASQGQVHKAIAHELQTLVADPFDEWAQRYKAKLGQSKSNVVENWLRSYELALEEVMTLKDQYLSKTRRADEAADDAKFAPNGAGDKYTTSPRLTPRDPRTPPQRTASVSERIAQRLREIQLKSIGRTAENKSEIEKAIEEENAILSPKIDKGKGKAVDGGDSAIASPPPMSPPLPPAKIIVDVKPASPSPSSPILVAGLSFRPAAISALLSRAAAELPLRSVRFPLLGEYPDCFTGEEFVAWLKDNEQGFGGNLDRAEDAARDLTEKAGLLRRIGEFGNGFVHSEDAFYQFRPKAFDLEEKNEDNVSTPINAKNALSPVADNLLKRSNTFVNLVQKALNANASSTPAHILARQDAEAADKTYRVAVRKLDRHRLGLEERIEDTLRTLQRGEAERLRAVKTVLLQYQGTLANLPKSLEPTSERSSTLIASFQPESDLTALIERYRTGPFRPAPQVYESITHDESDVVFGIDLRKWADGRWTAMTPPADDRKELIPPAITALLTGLRESYGKLPTDAEKRKVWIYEVPLPAVHHLREALNAVPPDLPIPPEVIKQYDAPVLASAVKLWALELDPPLALWEGWDDFRKLYPTVGSTAKSDSETSDQQHIQDLQVALQRLPKVHLYVLDALTSHLKDLIDTTTVDEPNEVYLTKLALSVGRSIIRPKFESEFSIQDRHPTLLFIDLVKHYSSIIPPTIARKKRESERKVPLRKRTAPVDMRLSRSRISVGSDPKQLLAAQQQAQNPSLRHGPSESITDVPAIPPVPSLPPVVKPEYVPAGDERPSFKEPPPEPEDDLPPRPSFKEPSPSPPPMPKFADPPAEENIAVIPPTPQKPASPTPPLRSGSASPTKRGSRTSMSNEDQVVGTGKTSLSRSGSGQSAGTPASPTSHVRGPRISRGPRAPAGGSNVGGIISTLNRASSPPASSSANIRRLSSSPVRLPMGSGDRGKHVQRTSLSRRTVASDAEDEVVGK